MVLVKDNFAINKSCKKLRVDSKNMLSFYVAPTVWTILTPGSLEKLKGIPFKANLKTNLGSIFDYNLKKMLIKVEVVNQFFDSYQLS